MLLYSQEPSAKPAVPDHGLVQLVETMEEPYGCQNYKRNCEETIYCIHGIECALIPMAQPLMDWRIILGTLLKANASFLGREANSAKVLCFKKITVSLGPDRLR